MPEPFKKLRDVTYCAVPRIQRSDLARALGCSTDHAIRLLNKRAEWTMREMYKTLDLIGAPPEELHIYFPKEDLINEKQRA